MPLRYWIFVFLTLLLTCFIGYGTFTTARLLQRWQPDRNLLLLPTENLFRLLLIGVCVLLGWLSGLTPQQLGWQWEAGRGFSYVLTGVGWGVLMAAIFYLATRWVIARTGERFYSPVIVDAIIPSNWTTALLVALAMIPVVLVEELLFRSLLLGGFMPIAPTAVLLIGWGLVFGVMHSPQGMWGVVGAALAGILFGALFLWYGTVAIPIMAHYVTNILQIGIALGVRGPGTQAPSCGVDIGNRV